MKPTKMFIMMMALVSELTVLIVIFYFLGNSVAESYGLDNNLVSVGFIGGAFAVWFVHVALIFSKLNQKDDDISGSSGDSSSSRHNIDA